MIQIDRFTVMDKKNNIGAYVWDHKFDEVVLYTEEREIAEYLLEYVDKFYENKGDIDGEDSEEIV